MTNSHSSKWIKIRHLEEALALLTGVNRERILIKNRTLNSGDEESFLATERQKNQLEKLKFTLSARWHELMEEQ